MVHDEGSDSVALQHMSVGRLLLDMARSIDARPHRDIAVNVFPRLREQDAIFVLVSRASHARAMFLTSNDPDEHRAVVATLGGVLALMEANDQIRVSRFTGQTRRWLEETRATRIGSG